MRTRRFLDRKIAFARESAAADLRDLRRALAPSGILASVRSVGPKWVLNVAVAGVVLSLPFAASAASSQPAVSAPSYVAPADSARASTIGRGGTISAARGPVTVNAEGVRPIQEYKLGPADTLQSLSNFFKVSDVAIAYANGITDPANLEVGRTIRIPPGEGALYTVVDGDTYASVAAKFKVEESAIMDYNRLYFEPEHFAPGQLIFVPGATMPGLVYIKADPDADRPTVIARAANTSASQARSTGSGAIGWPVAGPVITQYYWAGHTGVDLAVPYGTTIVAPLDGVVSAAGWVNVGGLRVCVTGGGYEACSYHTGAVFVSVGQAVARGQAIASVGMTGVTTGPHDHFEVKLNGAFIDPMSVLH